MLDIWRLKNPIAKRYTFRQRHPLVQSRLDYFMISNCMTDIVDKAQILTSFCSDHSCIALNLSPLPKQDRGLGYWKFNASLTSDSEYITQLNQLLDQWLREYEFIIDKRLTWDLLKYEIRKFTCKYCAKKKLAQRAEEQLLHSRLEDLETELGITSDSNISNEYYTCKERLKELEEHKANGIIIRSKVQWLEKGEKSTQYFFSLEKFNYIKKQVRKLILDNGETVTTDKEIIK